MKFNNFVIVFFQTTILYIPLPAYSRITKLQQIPELTFPLYDLTYMRQIGSGETRYLGKKASSFYIISSTHKS